MFINVHNLWRVYNPHLTLDVPIALMWLLLTKKTQKLSRACIVILIKNTDQQFTHFWLTSTQCRLKAWACWADALGPHTNLCKLCTICFFMFKHWFCWKYQYNKYMFNFIDHLHFYSCELFCWSGHQCIASAQRAHALRRHWVDVNQKWVNCWSVNGALKVCDLIFSPKVHPIPMNGLLWSYTVHVYVQ
jgi:hypothetical protein